MWESGTFLGALTPKFYVALTGTSSLISGLILIFEWWYFRKYGTSFIERVSLGARGGSVGGANGAGTAQAARVWRNPHALLRGAEYARLWAAARRAPLAPHDLALTAHETQQWFALEEPMARAWRETEPGARVAAARRALAARPDCPQALLLLAEEDAPTVMEADRMLKRAWRCAEAAVRASALAGGASSAEARRDALLLAHVKRRAGVCARRLGRLRDAARLFRELARDAPPALGPLAPHESLLEVLVEQRAWGEAGALVARLEEGGAPASAALLYTSALLRARAGEPGAADAMSRAVEYNPYVPEYLLELRALALPPEHVVRRGESEALAYAFAYLAHWRGAEGALALLARAWRAGGAGAGAAGADRSLLAPHHAPREAPALLPAAAGACAAAALLALAAHRWPDAVAALDPRAMLRLLVKL